MQRQREGEEVIQRVPPLDPATAGASAGNVRVLAGADVEDMALAGRTVGEARVLAQAILGIDPGAAAMLDGNPVAEDCVLGEGQELEFVKHAGAKGASVAAGSVVELAAGQAVWSRNGEVLGKVPVHELLARVVDATSDPRAWSLLPRFTRMLVHRPGGVTGVVIEMPPGPRQVRWIVGSRSYESEIRYETRRLSFPWVVLLVVFRNGDPTGMQQAYYRPAPLATLDDPLFLTNLLNVARVNNQVSWICLQNIGRRMKGRSWEQRVQDVVDHFWQAAFNWGADREPGSGYYADGGGVDHRLRTVETWEAATQANPYFALEVVWRRAPQTVRSCMESLLEAVAPYRPITSTEQVVTLMQQKRR